MSVRAFTALVSPQRSLRDLSAGNSEPRFAAALARPKSGWRENLLALLSGPRPEPGKESAFHDAYVGGHVPSRSLAWSTCWHIVALLLLLQFGQYVLTVPQAPAFDVFQLACSGPIEDLPLLADAMPVKKAVSPKPANKPAPPPKADEFHPTQTIVSAPKLVTHPRQTLIRPDALQEAPKILPAMPNIVIWDQTPERPRLQITAEQWAHMKPMEPQQRPQASAAVPEMPNEEERVADLNFAAAPPPPKPMLPIEPGASMVAAPKNATQRANSVTAPPPESSSGKNGERLIAISATPAPVPPEAPVPNGNLAAHVVISPNKSNEASAGVAPGKDGGGKPGEPAEISISGGAPRKSTGTSGLGGDPGAVSRSLHVSPGMAAPADVRPPSPLREPDVPVAARLKPGAPAEILLTGRVYTLHVNMPNLSSATGSWVLNFAEMNEDDPYAPPSAHTGELTAPQALHKVYTRYPSVLAEMKIQGEVVLYAIIRKDGSVDSIQLVHKLDPVLDQNARQALAHWKFRPAERAGSPVPVEAVIHIPFHFFVPEQ